MGKTGYVRLGAFILAGVVLSAAGIVVFGSGAFQKEGTTIETYVRESVQGLAVGSPVKFRGVQIGRVEAINLLYTQYDLPAGKAEFEEYRTLVVIRMKIFPGALEDIDDHTPKEVIDDLVANRVRLRLSSQGLTGVAYLEADYISEEQKKREDALRESRPAMPGEPKIAYGWVRPSWTPRHQYVPSASSTATRLTESAESVVNALDRAHLDLLANEVTTLVQEISRTMKDDVSPTLKNVNTLLTDLTPAIKNIGDATVELAPAVKNIRQITDDLAPAAKDIANTTKDLPDTASKINDIATRLDGTLADIARNVDDLSTKLQEIIAKLDAAVDRDLSPTLANLHETSNGLPETVQALQNTIKRVDHLVAGETENVDEILASLRTISRDVEQLSTYAKKYPSHLLFGNPPPPRERK